MKQLSILILLLLTNWIVLYGQTGINDNGDTIVCYTTNEVRKIAIKLVETNKCNEILRATEVEVNLQKEIIKYCEQMVINLDTVVVKKEKIINNHQLHIGNLEKELIKEKRRSKFLRSGFTISSVTCGVLIILHLIN
jgi:hypothetical protein